MRFAEYVWVLKIRDYTIAWSATEKEAKIRESWVGENNVSINLVNINEIHGLTFPNVADIPYTTWIVLAKLANECDELHGQLMNAY